MSKANTIRKRVQQRLKKRDWEGAIKEYRQLSELDQSNPNIYNELGDLYLKINKKFEAMKSFENAAEAYSRVGLFNNAVAVCKKLLRLQSSNNEIIAKLGSIRKQQGFLKEAVTFYSAYLDKLIVDVSIKPEEIKKKVLAVVKDLTDSAEVLHKSAEFLIKWELKEDAANVLLMLRDTLENAGKTDLAAAAVARIGEIGIDIKDIDKKAGPPSNDDVVRNEDELWVKDLPSEGARIDIESGARSAPPPESPRSSPAPAAASQDAQDFGAVNLEKSSAGVSVDTAESDDSEPSAPDRSPEAPTREFEVISGGHTLEDGKVWIPNGEVPDPLAAGDEDMDGKVVHVSQIIDEFKSEIRESVDEEDFRSHYDLGMAYLEMDFLTEAVREFQFAAKSNAYMVKSLEMIGMCFLNQNQPSLAIKQLQNGLEAIGSNDRETLGLRYNLALAYEMAGDLDNARSCFEDVYVIDVTFREVAGKIKKYSG